MPPYKEKFLVGTKVSVLGRPLLDEFKRTWKYHHPLETRQLEYAGFIAKVKTVGFYHGGDALYTLENIPGIWHEECLRPA
jgi:hypothetical protein